MLFNPDWSKPAVKADPFKLETLISWLEKQPAKKEYCYVSTGHCLLAQYFTAQGFENVLLDHVGFYYGPFGEPSKNVDLEPFWGELAIGHPRTFGAALERARSLITSRGGSPNSTDQR